MKHSKSLLPLMMVVFAIVIITFTGCVSSSKPPVPVILTPPVNIYPTDAELIESNFFYARWTKSTKNDDDPVIYTLNYARTIEGLEESFDYETPSNYFLFLNLEPGVYYWRVSARAPGGQSVSSPVWTFTVDTDELPVPEDPEKVPPDPVLIVSDVEYTSFTLDWDNYIDPVYPTNQITYTINVYEDNQGISQRNYPNNNQLICDLARTTPAATAQTTDTTHLFQNMKANTHYLWTLIASADASRSSAVGNGPVTTGNRPPTKPELLNPTDNATNMDTNVTLTWSESSDPDGDEFKYYVFLDTVKNTNKKITVEGIETTRFQPQNLEEGRTYYWFILVKDTNGSATRTEAQAFTTKAVENLSIPHSPTPEDGSQDMDSFNPPLLEWEHEKKNNPITYSIFFSDNPNKMEKQAQGLTDKAYQIPGTLKSNTKYYWQVEAKDTQTGKTTLSQEWTFKTAAIAPPNQIGAETNKEGTQIELTYDKPMKDPSGKHTQYIVKNSGETPTVMLKTVKIESKPGTTTVYILTLEEKIVFEDTLAIDYITGNIQSQDGGYMEPFRDYPVVNQVPAEKPVITHAQTVLEGNDPTQSHMITLYFDKAMAPPQPEAIKDFSMYVNGQTRTIKNLSPHPTDTTCYLINLQETQPILYGNTISLTYLKGTIQAQNGKYLDSFSDYPVQNTVNPVPPQVQRANTNIDRNKITLTFDKAMEEPVEEGENFTLTLTDSEGNPTGNIAIQTISLSESNPQQMIVTLATPIPVNQNSLLSYTPGNIQSQQGALLAAFSQPVINEVSDPPQVQSLYTDHTGEAIILTFDKAMEVPDNEAGNFSLSISRVIASGARQVEELSITNVQRRDNTSQFLLTPQEAIHNGDTATLTYTPGNIQSQDSGWLQAFSKPITNVVEGDAPVVTQAVLDENGTTIAVTFSLKMEDNPNAKKDQFTVKVDSATQALASVHRKTDEPYVYLFTLDNEVLFGQQVTLSYSKGSIKAVYGSYLESFSNYPVENTLDPVPPQVERAQTNDSGDQITLTFDKAMEEPINEASNFSVVITNRQSPHTNARTTLQLQSIELSQSDSKQMILEINGSIQYGDTARLHYNPGNIQSTQGATMAAFSEPIINNVPVPPPSPPSCTGAKINSEGRQIELTFNKAIKSLSGNQHDQFTVYASGTEVETTAGQLKSGNNKVIVLDLGKPIGKNNTVQVSYAKGNIQSTDNAYLGSFQNKVVDTSALEILWVVKNIGWNYSTIQDAINAADNDDKIMVYQGTYEENIDFDASEVHLSSADPTDLDIVSKTIISPKNNNSPIITIDSGQETTILEGFTITGEATGVYCSGTTPIIRNNTITASNCSIELKNATPTIYANTFERNDDGVDIRVGTNSQVKNEAGDLWRVFNLPFANQSDVEHLSNGVTSNTFSGTNPEEGQYITFIRNEIETQAGGFTVSPASVTSNRGENITIQASYTPAVFISNGTITYTVDDAIDLNNISVTVAGEELDASKIATETGTIKISEFSAEEDEQIELDIVLTDYLHEQTDPCAITITVDRDGQGSLYTPSEEQSDSFSISNKLKNLELEGDDDPYEIIKNENGPFWSYTVKVKKDAIPERFQGSETWQITVDGTEYDFRLNQFDNTVLQCDNIPTTDTNGDSISENDIKESKFEPEVNPG